jgi:sulfur carrier protein ThiS
MQIEVAAFATLRRYMPDLKLGDTRRIEVEPGTTMKDVMECLGLPADEVEIIMRNHVHAALTDTVADGDRIVYIPLIDGG